MVLVAEAKDQLFRLGGLRVPSTHGLLSKGLRGVTIDDQSPAFVAIL